jgi:uncharacterized protein (TIGR03086 family)
MDEFTPAERAYAAAGRLVSGVRREQLDRPTPCDDWDVRALVNHMIVGHFYFAGALRGESMDPTAEPPDFAADDPAAAFDQASKTLLETWREAGAMERTVETMAGPMPGQMLFGMLVVENLVHGWDLARATGRSEDLEPELAGQMLAMVRQANMPRGAGAPFQPEQPAPANAGPAQQLAAYLGRKV